jgi:hypothetical protein
MATSKCPKCDGTSFELKELKIKDSNFRINGIQCSHCGCVIGTSEYFNTSELILKLAKKLNINLLH